MKEILAIATVGSKSAKLENERAETHVTAQQILSSAKQQVPIPINRAITFSNPPRGLNYYERDRIIQL